MFAAIARFDIRFRWLIVAVWLVGVVAGGRLLPGLTTVSHASNGQFNSSSSPSVRASQLAAPFQVVDPKQTATIVASRASGPLTAADTAAMSQVEQAVRQVPVVTSVKDGGTSPDGRAAQALVTVPGSVSSSNSAATDVVQRIRAAMAHADAPPGLDLHLAGPLAVEADACNTESGGITRFTLLFVIVVLFVVYRAALAPLVTLAGSRPPRSEFGSGWVGRERAISREESAATSAGHSPCLREINVPDGRRSPLPPLDTVVCQERVTRHLAFCPARAPATIRYGVPLVRTANPATLSTVGDSEVADGRFASTPQNRTAGKALRAARLPWP